jgi:hypothetical protein
MSWTQTIALLKNYDDDSKDYTENSPEMLTTGQVANFLEQMYKDNLVVRKAMDDFIVANTVTKCYCYQSTAPQCSLHPYEPRTALEGEQ